MSDSSGPDDQAPPAKPRKPSRQQVYTLLIEVGRKAGDGLPKGATGAGILCFASGVDEAEAVRETVAILKEADLAPLDVTGYGTLDERLSLGHEIDGEERALMQRALDENSVIVVQMTPFYGDGDRAEAGLPEAAPKTAAARPSGPKAPRPAAAKPSPRAAAKAAPKAPGKGKPGGKTR